MEGSPATLELHGSGAAVLRLAHPDNPRNQLGVALVDALERVLRDEAPDLRTHALIVISGSEKAFSTGADIEGMGDISHAEAERFSDHGKDVFGRLSALPYPTIAALGGFVLGGGLELALACDFRVCAAQARLALPEIDLGIIPGWGGTQRLARLIGRARALRMILSGEKVNAETALAWGLVDQLPEPGESLLDCALRFASRFAGKPRAAVALARQAVHGGLELSLAEGLALESRLFGSAWDSAERREGVAALREKRRAVWPEG